MNLTNYTFKFTDLSNNPKQVSSSLQKYGFVVLHSLPQNYVKEVCKEVITHFDVTEGPLQKPRSAPFVLNIFDKYMSPYINAIEKFLSISTEHRISRLSHSDTHFNSTQGRYHRDALDKKFVTNKLIKEDSYFIYKAGFYLSSYKKSRPTLYVVPGSHRRALNVFQLFLISIQRFAITYLNRYVGNNLTRFLPSIFSAFPISLQESSVVLFDQRLVHAGARASIRSTSSKIAVYVSFGYKDSEFTREHEKIYGERQL